MALLSVAAWFDGAFPFKNWGPLAVFALVAVAAGRRNTLRGPAVAMAGAMWAFALWGVASALWGESPDNALRGAARDLLYAALLSLPLLTLPSRIWGVRVARLIVAIAAALVALTFIACLVDGTAQFLAGRLNTPVDYRNGTAALFAMLFWLLVALSAQREAHALVRAGCFALAVLALGFAFLTQSRGVVIGFGTGGVVAVILGPDRLRRAWLGIIGLAAVALASHRLLQPWDTFLDTNATSENAVRGAIDALGWLAAIGFGVSLMLALLDGGLRVSRAAQRTMRAVAVAGLVVLAVGGVAVAAVSVDDPVQLAHDKVREFKMQDTVALGQTRLGRTGGQRYDLWRVAWLEFRSAPLGGVGEGSYQFDYFVHRRTDQNLTNAHSLPIGVLAEEGIVGLALLAGVLIGAAVALRRGWPSASMTERRWASALASAAAVLIGQSTVDWLWLIPGLTGLAFVCLGTAVAIVSLPRTDVAPRRSALWSAARAVPALAAAMVSLLFLSDVYVRSARAATAAPSEQRLDTARTAARLDPFAIAPLYLQASAQEELGHRRAARRALLDALDREPRNFTTLGLLGDLETRAGNRPAARRWYRRALALNPGDTGLQQLAR